MRGRLRPADIAVLRDALQPEPEPDTPKWLREAEHRRLVVHAGNQTFKGILRQACEDGLLLWGAETFEQGKPVMLEGEVFIPRDKVLFVQTVRM